MLKEYGSKVTKIIDNFLDRGIDKISWEDKYYIYELCFEYNKIYQGKLKKIRLSIKNKTKKEKR